MAEFPETSMAAVFQNRAQKFGSKACVAYKNSKGVYEDISWNTLNEMVRNLACYLLSKGIKPGDKVALFSTNRYEWWVTDLAILSVGAVNVPIYPTNSAQEARYVIENSDSKMCFAGQAGQMDRVLSVKQKLPNLKDVILLDDLKPGEQGLDFRQAMKLGSAYPNKAELDERIRSIRKEELATIIYTSGTTGDPKGVMLSHSNFLSNVEQLYYVNPPLFEQEHVLLSFLPLSHSLERTVGYYSPMSLGHKVCFAEDFSKILKNFQEVRPTLLVSVPRLYEKIHTGILAKIATAPPLKRMIFSWAMGLARKNLPYVCNDVPRAGIFALMYAVADKLVFSKLKAGLGMDRLQYALSGGGPLSVSDAEFYLGMGIQVCEGFGLTETSPVTNGNAPGRIKPGTVGQPVRNTIVKIGEGGEVLIKGPQVMMGYYKNEAATKEVMTGDGFFRTGDIGEIDADGNLKITGRIKDLIITSGGKNVSPQNIENSLKTSNFIEQTAVIGDNRKYLSALIVPAFSELEAWAKNSGVSFSSRQELLASPEVQKLYASEIENHMQNYARVEQIRKFCLLDREWSQETDELTPTLKVKRRVVSQKYTKEIESMYADDKGE